MDTLKAIPPWHYSVSPPDSCVKKSQNSGKILYRLQKIVKEYQNPGKKHGTCKKSENWGKIINHLQTKKKISKFRGKNLDPAKNIKIQENSVSPPGNCVKNIKIQAKFCIISRKLFKNLKIQKKNLTCQISTECLGSYLESQM